MQNGSPNFTEQSIVIVGVGLIGGSIAAAVRQRFPECKVIGIGRNRERLKLATERGLLTDWSDQISAAAIPGGSLGIVCLPVDQIAGAVQLLVDADCELVTDAGSVKASVYAALDDISRDRFIGSHPIAGSELTGFEHSDAELFVNRLCVVTPVNATSNNTERIVAFWKSIGATVQQMSPDEHDRVLALTSHLPAPLHFSGITVLSNRTAASMHLLHSMAGTESVKIMPLDHARKAIALCYANDIDVLIGSKKWGT